MSNKQYLKASNLCESNSKEIKSLTKKIVGDKKGVKAARTIFNWVQDNVKWDIISVVGAKKLLKRHPKKAICIDKNNLMVAMSRSVGIPARYILMKGKLKVKKKILDKEISHVASEVFVGGKWIISDPAYGEDTKKIIQPCKFGKPVWKSVKEITRMSALPKPMFPTMINKALRVDPLAKLYRKELKKLKR